LSSSDWPPLASIKNTEARWDATTSELNTPWKTSPPFTWANEVDGKVSGWDDDPEEDQEIADWIDSVARESTTFHDPPTFVSGSPIPATFEPTILEVD